uniref:Uncharacterized protein n=1 Tax=Caenorhabditis japonica TaxID=281687 RepID=A0A8R1E477_CAEJA
MDRSTISTVGGKRRLALVIEKTSSEPLPTLRQISTKLMRSLESMSALSSALSSVTDVAHIHSNKTMLPLTPATPQRTFRFSCLLKWTTIKNIQDLKTALQREWDAVSVGEPKKLVATMPNRMFEVIKKMVEKRAVDNCLLDSIFLIDFVFSLQ